MATKKKTGGSNHAECAYCSTTEGDLKKYTRCRLVFYCSKACQTAHWKAQPGHRDRCIAPKDRKPSAIKPEVAKDETDVSKVAEKELCGVCFEPLLAENVLQCEAPHAGTQTLDCKHSFHLKCASELTSLSASPVCPLCRGPFSSMLAETLFIDAEKGFGVIKSMVNKEQITWATLPSTVKTRMRSVLRKYLEAANRGHADAQSNLGTIYFYGSKGVKQDVKEAMKYSRQAAADQGSAISQFNLGRMYDNGQGITQDFKKAVEWYRQAADQGNVDAQFNLGAMYHDGQGVKKNFKEAAKWFRQAAEQGDSGAQFNLGLLFENGKGAKQNFKDAVKLYRKAAHQGDAQAQSRLGMMFRNGQGVKQDFREAAKWYRQAAEQRNSGAQVNLDRP